MYTWGLTPATHVLQDEYYLCAVAPFSSRGSYWFVWMWKKFCSCTFSVTSWIAHFLPNILHGKTWYIPLPFTVIVGKMGSIGAKLRVVYYRNSWRWRGSPCFIRSQAWTWEAMGWTLYSCKPGKNKCDWKYDINSKLHCLNYLYSYSYDWEYEHRWSVIDSNLRD